MNTKKKYIILSLAILLVGFGLIGGTFAWYSYSNAESRVSAKVTKDKPNVIFTQTEYINVSTIMPIKDEDRYNYGTKNSFIITFPESLKNYETFIEMNLVDIKIDEELKINAYKYELLENNVIISSGNFSGLEENTMEISPRRVFHFTNLPTTNNYELIIWLSDDGTTQNDLMNKEFSAKINIVTATKKR